MPYSSGSWRAFSLFNMSSWLGPGDIDISHGLVGSSDYDYDYSKDRHSYEDSASDRHSGYGGYGSHNDHGYGKEECCPLVVDLLCLAAILGAIAGASILLSRVMLIELTMQARRKRAAEILPLAEGEHATTLRAAG